MDIDIQQIKDVACRHQKRAKAILDDIRIIEICEHLGCRVNLVGSLRMGLLVNHRDIDLHIYSKHLTVAFSFEVISKIASHPNVLETHCINGLDTDERCIEWHLKYRDVDNECWQIDIIHIEEGSKYDGYFERMADRICEIITPEQSEAILKLKYQACMESDIHGAEIYEAVIEEGIEDFEELKNWVKQRRLADPYFWSPK